MAEDKEEKKEKKTEQQRFDSEQKKDGLLPLIERYDKKELKWPEDEDGLDLILNKLGFNRGKREDNDMVFGCDVAAEEGATIFVSFKDSHKGQTWVKGSNIDAADTAEYQAYRALQEGRANMYLDSDNDMVVVKISGEEGGMDTVKVPSREKEAATIPEAVGEEAVADADKDMIATKNTLLNTKGKKRK